MPCAPRTLDWPDLTPNENGIIFAYLKNDHIAQIEVAAPRYHTVDGITKGSSPENVRLHYPNVQAYGLVHSAVDFLGGRDLIFWIDRQNGIAFEFQHNLKTGKRYVASVNVFISGTDFVPHGRCVESPQAWRSLKPFALEPTKGNIRRPQ